MNQENQQPQHPTILALQRKARQILALGEKQKKEKLSRVGWTGVKEPTQEELVKAIQHWLDQRYFLVNL